MTRSFTRASATLAATFALVLAACSQGGASTGAASGAQSGPQSAASHSGNTQSADASASANGLASGDSATSGDSAASSAAAAEQVRAEVTIEDNRGSQTVPTKPTSVVVTDNRLFETLEAWGVKVSAAPKPILAPTLKTKTDESVVDLGSHREPKLDALVPLNPQVVFNGQRFAQHYDTIKGLLPEAKIVDLDVREDQPFDAELRRQTTALGEIFGRKADAKKLIADFDASIARVKAAYKPEQKVMTLIVSGGEINYAAPKAGRTLGPVYDILGLQPSLTQDGSTDHQGDEISVEAIAATNPEWILVMDRDAAVKPEDGTTATPAVDVLKNSAPLANVPAVKKGQIVVMPADTYTNESIQTYTEYFNSVADAMEKAK